MLSDDYVSKNALSYHFESSIPFKFVENFINVFYPSYCIILGQRYVTIFTFLKGHEKKKIRGRVERKRKGKK